MVLGKANANRVVLVAGDLLMEQKADMNLFYVTEQHIINKKQPRKGVAMEITLKRKIMSEMMTTYLPSVLLMLITFATTFFKPFFFEAALSVNLTTMLVMTTIFISKMESLSPTSDIKMIDIWLILCQLVPFAQVVLLTAMEYLREEEEVEKQEVDPQVTRGKEKGPDEHGVELSGEDEPKPQEAWHPMKTEPVAADKIKKLLTIGKLPIYHSDQNTSLFHVSEKKLMPLAVFAAFIIYACTAMGFYFYH